MPGSDDPLGLRLGSQIGSGASLSGHERDHVFLNIDGQDYVEVSGLSGLDHPSDGRAYGRIDFDRDGRVDFATVSANAPLLQLFRNEIGGRDSGPNGMVAVRFEGGNRTGRPSDRWSARDGYGARALIELEGRTLLREHRAGEGFGAQNSAVLMVGLGQRPQADRLTVVWPSGVHHDTTAVTEGTLVTAYEDPSTSPTGAPFVFSTYRTDRAAQPVVASADEPGDAEDLVRVAHEARPGARADLVLYTTVATWCVPCLDELPALRTLRDAFSEDELEIFGVPYDAEEDPERFTAWSGLNGPPYEILADLDAAQRERVVDLALDSLRVEGLPTATVTDSEGNVLLVRWGPPTISELRAFLARRRDTR